LELDSLTAGGIPGLLAGFNANANYSWQFLSASAGISGFNASEFTVDTSMFQNGLNGTFNVSLTNGGTGLALNYLAAVPEPTSAWFALTGAMFLLHRRGRSAGKTDTFRRSTILS
jgi:hypothetical protein